jgi:hypothetical protein
MKYEPIPLPVEQPPASVQIPTPVPQPTGIAEDLVLQNIFHRPGEKPNEIQINGEAHNPTNVAVDKLYCIAYQPRVIAWGPVTMQPGETVPFSATVNREESKGEIKVLLTRISARHVIDLNL